MTLRNVRRKLEAFKQGGPIPIYSSKVTRINGNPLVLSFVRMSGENRAWAIAYGRALDATPKFLSVPDPRSREAIEEMMTKFSEWFLAESGVVGFSSSPIEQGVTEIADLPQIWLPGASHVELLHFIQYQYQKSRRLEEKQSTLGSFGRFAGWLFKQSRLKGNQLVVDVNKLLNEMYEFPADDFSVSHLGVQLAWLTTPGSIDQKREAALLAAKETISITMAPEFENDVLDPLVKDQGEILGIGKYTKEESEKIHQKLIPELERRWKMTVKAHALALADPRPENREVAQKLLPDLLKAFDLEFNKQEAAIDDEEDTFTMSPDGGYSAYATARDFMTVTHFEEKWLPLMVHDDVEILRDALFEGSAFVGKVAKVGSKFIGDKERITWTIELSPRSSRLYKRRDSEDLSVFTLPNRKLQVESFDKREDSWFVTVSWGSGAQLTLNGFTSVPSDERWIGLSHSYVPTYAENFYYSNLQALKKALDGPLATLFAPAEANEVVDVIN